MLSVLNSINDFLFQPAVALSKCWSNTGQGHCRQMYGRGASVEFREEVGMSGIGLCMGTGAALGRQFPELG